MAFVRKNLANTQDLVEIEEIRDNTVILKDGSLRQIVMVSGLNFALKSETEQNIITASYQTFLNGLDFQIHIVVHSRKINIEKYLLSLEERKQHEQSALLQNQIAEYQEFVAGFVRENAIMEKSFFVVVPWKAIHVPGSGGLGGGLPFMKKDAAAASKKREDELENFAENVKQLEQRVEQVVEGLSALDLDAVVLNDQELVQLFYNFYNPETIEKKDMGVIFPAATK